MKVLDTKEAFKVKAASKEGFRCGAEGKLPDPCIFYQKTEEGRAYRKAFENGKVQFTQLHAMVVLRNNYSSSY
jgi:hypothetical protein